MRNLILLFVVAAAMAATINLPAVGAEPRKGALTSEQLEQQAALLAEFRKARPNAEKRLEIIDRAAELSSFTLKNILEIIAKELNKPLADYRQQFMKAVGKELSQRANSGGLQEIGDLRTRILALSKQEKLTKEMIVAASDPGLKRLKELILVDRDQVLKQHPELIKKRESLEALGKQWEQCAARLLEERAEDATDATNDQGTKGKAAAGGKTASDVLRETEEMRPPSFEQYLLKEEEIAGALALPMDATTRAVLSMNSQLAGKIDPEEARCVLDLNLTRNLLGLAAVQIDLTLTAVARDHSSDMERLKFFSHDSPVPGKTTPWDRAKRANTAASAENIAAGTLDGATANEMWWHSPGHHKNMLGDHVRVGVGRSGKYWTELFGR